VPLAKTRIAVSLACIMGVSTVVFSQEEKRGLTLSASAVGTYSDNYLRLSDAKVAERPLLAPQEYFLETNATLGWNQKIGRQYLSVNADAGYRFNKNNSYLDTEFINADAALNWSLGSKCEGSISISYNRAQGDFESLNDILPNSVTRKSAAADAVCLFTSRLAVVVGGDIYGADNSAASRSLNDLESQEVRTGLKLSLRGDDYISFMANQVWRQYNNRFVSAIIQPPAISNWNR